MIPDRASNTRLNANYQAFLALETRARRLLASDLDGAAAFAQLAGALAWLNHAGLFASAPLEIVLRELAGRLSRPGSPLPRLPVGQGGRQRTLHVLTAAYETGGHTRMVARWIEQDASRAHDVVITRQQGRPVPRMLVDVVHAGAGHLTLLDRHRGGLLERASELRDLAANAGAVLVSAHPYDVVPIVAAATTDTPFIYVNHADHVFWLGTGAASVLMNLRDSGRRLSVARRGVAPERCAVLARPLGTITERAASREDAKRRLGIDPAAVVLFTAAAGSKYEPIEPPSFLELLVPVLEDDRRAVLVAAGPNDAGPWAEAAARTHGRVRALGRRVDMPELHAAADVYIDSYPFASLTSLTEAGCCAVPLVAYHGHPDEAEVLGVDSPGLDETVLQPREPEAFRAELARLIADPGLRSDLGRHTRDAIMDTHVGDTWRSGCEALYAQAAALSPAPEIGDAPRATGILDVLVDRLQLQTGYGDGLRGTLGEHAALLPARYRVMAWIKSWRDGARLPVRALIPEWLMTSIRTRRGR